MSLKMWEETPREMGGSGIKDTWRMIIVETLLPASEIREGRTGWTLSRSPAQSGETEEVGWERPLSSYSGADEMSRELCK